VLPYYFVTLKMEYSCSGCTLSDLYSRGFLFDYKSRRRRYWQTFLVPSTWIRPRQLAFTHLSTINHCR